MPRPDSFSAAIAKIRATLIEHDVRFTLGGEPTYVPNEPVGSEWSITALGPTKLGYAYAFANALIAQALPNAVPVYAPGKHYPGEANPRWSVVLVWNRDGSPFVPALARPLTFPHPPTVQRVQTFRRSLLRRIGLQSGWLRASDPLEKSRCVWVLPLDHGEAGFRSEDWGLGPEIELLRTEGPAGLRLPLHQVPSDASRRALTVEIRDGIFHVFLPPLLQRGFLELYEHAIGALHAAKLGPTRFAGYIPSDAAGSWIKLGVTADPGVLEINLPPCVTCAEYREWMESLERAGRTAGLRSFKQISPEETIGTGGGNHLLFGGPSLDDHPFFTRPNWIASILRYWQHHPALAYLFTGQYVGPSSQAPRPDESASALYDLEMAYRFIEQLPPGDHRYLISETLRHLHTDGSGNTHRSEVSFDKFWNANFDGGCRGLIEFRAVESLPQAAWMSAVAVLWQSLAVYLLAHPYTKPLIDHGDALHDRYFLPSSLWADFESILGDLREAGFDLSADLYAEIFDWRFPPMLEDQVTGARVVVRKAHEGWPLLCETPLEGGSTSRFVDTSIERLEIVANAEFARRCRLFVQGRELPLIALPGAAAGAGLRYRRSALHPCLHPGISVQLPLFMLIEDEGKRRAYRLDPQSRKFTRCGVRETPALGTPCKKLHRRLLTFDLRLP
jgi:uncharacterized protein (DUF2126 family)